MSQLDTFKVVVCRHIVTGGGDGCLNIWELGSEGGLGPRIKSIPLVLPEQIGIVPPPMIRSVDVHPSIGAFVIGTAACDIWQATMPESPPGTPRKPGPQPQPKLDIVHSGHRGEPHDVAMNPNSRFSHIFATASNIDCVFVWSASTRRVWSCCFFRFLRLFVPIARFAS